MDQGGTDPLTYLLNFGVIGVVLVLLVTGVLVTRRELDRANQRADEWKAQYEREAEAHGLTLRTVERERERGDVVTESSRTTAAILGYLGHRPTPIGGDGT